LWFVLFKLQNTFLYMNSLFCFNCKKFVYIMILCYNKFKYYLSINQLNKYLSIKYIFKYHFCTKNNWNLFDNISKRLQILSMTFHQPFNKVSCTRIAILLFQRGFRNVVNIFRNFYEMFHFSVEIFLRYFWKLSMLYRTLLLC